METEEILLALINHGPIEGTFTFDQKLAVMEGLSAINQVKNLKAASEAFVNKLGQIQVDESYMAVWGMFWAHNGIYTGPDYADELKELKRVIGETSC